MTLPFWISDAVMIAAQAALVALPDAVHPRALRRLRGAAWALVPALSKGSLTGDAAALMLTALGCLTLGWLLAAVTPVSWLKLGIVFAAVVDSILVFSKLLEQPNATLNAAAPAGGLPQLQFVQFGSGSMGYGDFFVAGVLGGVLIAERTPRLPVAIACLVFATAFDLLFFVTNELPATVPVALALIASELVAVSGRRREAPARQGAA
jgi:hypothetical protein